MFILGISKNLYKKIFFKIRAKKNKRAIGTSYEIICTFSCISKVKYEEIVFYNPVIIFNLHTSFPQNHISATNSTVTQCQDQFKSAAEFYLCVTHSFIWKAVYSDVKTYCRCRINNGINLISMMINMHQNGIINFFWSTKNITQIIYNY